MMVGCPMVANNNLDPVANACFESHVFPGHIVPPNIECSKASH